MCIGWAKRWLAASGALLFFLAVCASCTMPNPAIPRGTPSPSIPLETPIPSILQKPGPIAVGVGDSAPGFAMGAINHAGFDINVMNAIEDGLQIPVAPTPLASANREAKLRDHKATLIIATYSVTDQRNRDGIDFAGPYMVTPLALLVRANGTSITDDKNGLKGKSVCIVDGSTADPPPIPDVYVVRVQTVKNCVDLLRAGNTDAVFSDELILHGFTNAYRGEFKVILAGVFGNPQYYGVGLLKGHHEDCNKLNSVIKGYLSGHWRQDFKANLPDAAQAYPGNVPNGDFESRFKPTDSEMERLSCKL